MSTAGQPRELRLRRPDRCALCRVKLPAGIRATWHPATRVVTCLTCAVKVAPVGSGRAGGSGGAGASARREYERRHANREDRARAKLGTFGVLLTRLTDEPQSTRVWKTGADGERRVAARLAKLLDGTGVRLLHDRRIPGHGEANIDHLAVGPGGVTVIDTKSYRGKVRTERVGGLFSERRTVLTIAGRDRTSLVDGVERQMAAVRSIAEHESPDPVDIRGALCFVDPQGLPLLPCKGVRGILVAGTRATARLAGRPGPLGADAIAALYERLDAGLPAA